MPTSMSFLAIQSAYFRSEARVSWLLILPAGLVLAGLGGAFLATGREPQYWSFAVPSILFGLALIATGFGIGARTPRQSADLAAEFQSDPAAMLAHELPRMERVVRNLGRTQATFVVFLILAAVLHLAFGTPWARGLASALCLFAGAGLLIDGPARRRAVHYVQALEREARPAA